MVRTVQHPILAADVPALFPKLRHVRLELYLEGLGRGRAARLLGFHFYHHLMGARFGSEAGRFVAFLTGFGMPPCSHVRGPFARLRKFKVAHYHASDRFVSVATFVYAGVMYATAVVGGKVVRFKLSPALARAHRQNRGKSMTEAEAIAFVENKRRARALRRARPYLASRP